MGSFSKWFCQTMALLALAETLIGNAHALKCQKCKIGHPCTEKDCVADPYYAKLELDTTTYCIVALLNETHASRDCAVMNDWTNMTDGNNKCKELSASKFIDMSIALQSKVNTAQDAALISGKITLTEVAEFIQRQTQRDSGDDKMVTVCVCNSKDLCNSDEGIKELKKGKGGGSAALGDPGNHVAVIFLALAALVSGFLKSQ